MIIDQMQELLNRDEETSDFYINEVWVYGDNHYEFICRCWHTHLLFNVHAQYSDNVLIIVSIYEM